MAILSGRTLRIHINGRREIGQADGTLSCLHWLVRGRQERFSVRRFWRGASIPCGILFSRMRELLSLQAKLGNAYIEDLVSRIRLPGDINAAGWQNVTDPTGALARFPGAASRSSLLDLCKMGFAIVQ